MFLHYDFILIEHADVLSRRQVFSAIQEKMERVADAENLLDVTFEVTDKPNISAVDVNPTEATSILMIF